jgi:outer membrane murein-binding lipoprotein Lpp
MRITPKLLAVIISACVAAGASGTWVTNKVTSEPSTTTAVLDHARIDDARDAVCATKVSALEKQLDKLEDKLDAANKKLDRLLIRR